MILQESAYVGYAYSYPHKTAYRPLDPPRPLREVWKDEDRSALFLYLHVPYCEMRCGFCNLFARSRPQPDEIRAYLDALRRQAGRVRDALGNARFARMALGGGTPTYLGARVLDGLFDLAASVFGAAPDRIPCSVETSPGTADPDTLKALAGRGVSRVSIGIQSFHDAELAAIGRPERTEAALRALDRLRSFEFPVLNLDLIYGIPGQTDESWTASLRAALRFRPEELYLYPLYIRPLTGLARRDGPEEDRRLRLYRAGRSLLLEAGYRQESMRMFRLGAVPESEGPAYCCQDDGMVGLGPGARSYTRSLHYSTRFAVSPGAVKEILADYSRADFDAADHGFDLDDDEQKRRWVIKSLLRAEGFTPSSYAARFSSALRDDFPVLAALEEQGLLRFGDDRVALTDEGLERSDAVGPWLYSPAVRERMERSVLR